MKQIFIIEDEILVAKGIKQILISNGYNVAGIATNYHQAKQKLLVTRPDLILCDINLRSEQSGIDIIREIDPKYNIPFIFISAYSDPETIKEADKLVPCNYISKPFSEKQLLVSINRYFASVESHDSSKPTEKEQAVLRLIARGYSTKEIADELSVSFNTVETHRKNLMKKYEVKSMAEMICLATDRGWIEYKRP